MSRKVMKSNLKSSVSATMLIGASLLLSACSSNVTRFDYPSMGYNSGDQDISSYNGGFGGSSSSNAAPRSQRYSSTDDWLDRDKKTTNSASYNRGSVQSESVRDLASPSYKPRRISNFDSAPVQKSAVRSYRKDNRSGNTVTVSQGDTLYSISRRHGVKPADFMAANNMSDANIRIGQVLSVPSAGTRTASARSYTAPKPAAKFQYASDKNRKLASSHTVQSGDTLYSVARRHGISFVKLAQWNGLDKNAGLRVGQRLALKPGQRVAALQTPNRRNDASSKSGGLWVAAQPKKIAKRRPAAPAPKIQVAKVIKKQPKPVRMASLKVTPKAVKPVSVKRRKGNFRWPVRGRIITKFGPMANGKNNDGINFAVPMGTEVKAADNGVVAYAGSELKGYGQLILIRHANNFVSAYAHNSSLKVKRGDRIKRGQVVALVGKSGDVSQPQLHFELRKGAKPIDPTSYMSR